VHLQALRYLTACNRYSNTPAGLTEYLGLTKGTVSQTLAVLGEKGLLRKESSSVDRRVVHLHLSETGRALISRLLPTQLFARAMRELPDAGTRLEESLTELLRALQQEHGQRSFGVCGTCRYFQREAHGRFRCGLTKDPLSHADSALLCREHEAPDASH